MVCGLGVEEDASANGLRRASIGTPTYTGLGEREHLASSSNELETHIQDILTVIKYKDLNEIVLVGHSYGGMVATGVADGARERTTRLVYLHAFVSTDGQSLMDIGPPTARQRMHESAKAGDGWRVPSNPIPPDTLEADVKWISERRRNRSRSAARLLQTIVSQPA